MRRSDYLAFFLPHYSAFLVMVLLLGVGASAQAQPPGTQPAHRLAVPRRWRTEQIVLPPPFARDLKFRGVEDLRFSPGMFDARSPQFITYAFSFWLAPEPALTRELLQEQLLQYFRELAKVVARDSLAPNQIEAFQLRLAPADPPRMVSGHKVTRLAGELQWMEPFVTKQPQKLYLEVRFWQCDAAGRNCALVLVSPQGPGTEAGKSVWSQLEAVAAEFRCHIPAVRAGRNDE